MKLANKISIVIVFSVFISAFSWPLLVTASPPPIQDYYASDYYVHEGTKTSGTLASTQTDNEVFFTVRAAWAWFIFFYFWANVEFDFTNRVVDSVIVDLADTVTGDTMRVKVVYTSGDPDYFPTGAGERLSDGKYEFYVDSRIVDKVHILFDYSSVLGGDKYLKVDMIKLRTYNFPF